jgi:hypothetical protein
MFYMPIFSPRLYNLSEAFLGMQLYILLPFFASVCPEPRKMLLYYKDGSIVLVIFLSLNFKCPIPLKNMEF